MEHDRRAAQVCRQNVRTLGLGQVRVHEANLAVRAARLLDVMERATPEGVPA